MSDVTKLGCWPGCVEAIDWSQDGILAVASEENVELLVRTSAACSRFSDPLQFPNTESRDTEEEIASWQHIPLQTQWFSEQELPVKEPAPAVNYSIGEEISESFPIGIAWSSPGLAKHRRCALGALTSNLVLSIWSAEGKPQEEASWARRLIVNDALINYFIKDPERDESVLVSEPLEQIRLRTRIRSFSWSPAMPTSHPSGIVGTRLSWGQQIIAVANDDNQIVFVLINSPTSTLGASNDWSAKVLNHFSIQPDPENIFKHASTFDEIMQQQRFISHMSWSPWTVRGDGYYSVLAYVTNEDVRVRVITYNHDTIGYGDEIVYPNSKIRFSGPIRWCPWVEDNDKLTFAMFTHPGLWWYTVSATDASCHSRRFHDLDGRWDEVSGVVWECVRDGSLRLHFCSLASTMNYPTAVLKLVNGELAAEPSPSWREQINDTQALFSAQNDLRGNARSRVWGLSASPLGDFIAVCYSLHPSDLIEYGPPAERRSTIAISGLNNYCRNSLEFPAKDVSAEGVVVTLKKWVENTVENTDQISQFIEDTQSKMIKAYTSAQGLMTSHGIFTGSGEATKSGQPNLGVLITEVKCRAFINADTLKDRYCILISQVCSPTSSNELGKTLIAYRLAKAVQSLPTTLYQTTAFSSEILAAHRQLIHLIDAMMNETTIDSQNGSTHTLPKFTVDISEADICDICHAAIPFTDLATATCISGHEFPRCGLSFLAIQAPRITKYCGLCSTPFLSDEFLLAQEAGTWPSGMQKGPHGSREPGAGPGIPSVQRRGEPSSEASTPDIGAQEDTEMVDGQPQRGHNEAQRKDEEMRELPVSFARGLFLACDVCIYCGGKFVG